MSKPAIATLVLLALLASAQQQATPRSDPYDGVAKGKTYKSSFFGFSFTAPSGEDLLVQSREIRQPQRMLVFAYAAVFADLASATARYSEMFSVRAVPLRTVHFQDHVQDLVTRAKGDASAVVETGSATYGGRDFISVDSFQMDKKGKHKQNLISVFLLEQDGYALEFWVRAPDENKFARALKNMGTLQFAPLAPGQ